MIPPHRPQEDIVVAPFDPAAASSAEFLALNRFFNAIRAETRPDDPPTPLEETIAELCNIPDFLRVAAWAAWTPDRSAIVGSAYVGFKDTDENTHLVWCTVEVLPDYRRQGLGRRLLAEVVTVPQREGRRLMLTGTNARVPAGEAFLARLGGKRVLEGHTNQLVLADLDPALLTRWMTPDTAGRFTLEFWDGPYPEEHLESLAALLTVAINTMPRDDMDLEDMKFTPEQIRQQERQTLAGGNQRWSLVARDTASNQLAGFTEIVWNPSRPQILRQGGTGVSPQFRGHGLGKRLKAAMLDRVRRERPEARFVRTGNADSNGPMLQINHALGFRPYLSHTEWQVETDKALAYAVKASLP